MVKTILQYGTFYSTLKDSTNLFCKKINVSASYECMVHQPESFIERNLLYIYYTI